MTILRRLSNSADPFFSVRNCEDSGPPSGSLRIFFSFFESTRGESNFFPTCLQPSGHKKNGISVFLDSGWPQGPVLLRRVFPMLLCSSFGSSSHFDLEWAQCQYSFGMFFFLFWFQPSRFRIIRGESGDSPQARQDNTREINFCVSSLFGFRLDIG